MGSTGQTNRLMQAVNTKTFTRTLLGRSIKIIKLVCSQKVYPTAKEAESKAGEEIQNDFNKAQKHDKKFEQIMKRESFR